LISRARIRRSDPGLPERPTEMDASIARTAIAAACRSVRPSANCNTITSDNTPGDSPGAPRTPNASVNGSSTKTSARRSRARIARLPFGNAARATTTVCSGISGNPTGRIDIRTASRTARQEGDPANDHRRPGLTPGANCAAES
jgi:hypothetical protein